MSEIKYWLFIDKIGEEHTVSCEDLKAAQDTGIFYHPTTGKEVDWTDSMVPIYHRQRAYGDQSCQKSSCECLQFAPRPADEWEPQLVIVVAAVLGALIIIAGILLRFQ